MQRVGGTWNRGSDALELVRHAAARFGRDDLAIPPGVVTATALRDVVAVADVHRLAGCVGAGLADVSGVPPEVADALAAAHRASTVRHLVAVRGLSAIADEFDRRDLRWLVMKGPVLAAHHYRDTGARAYGDLDLLVHPADLSEATQVLEDAGYEHKIRNWPLARWFGAAEFQMRSGRVELDVHWHLLYAWYDRTDVAIDLDAVFERVRRVGVGELAVPTFDAADTVVFLGLHASKSGCHRLVWLKDIERAIAIDDPDLDEVVRRARAFRIGPRVGLPLSRSASLLSANVPDDVIDALMPRSLRVLDRMIGAASPQLRADESGTLVRWWSRSMRSSPRATAAGLVDRTRRNIQRRRATWPGDESADPTEKRRFLDEAYESVGAPLATRVERIRGRDASRLATELRLLEPRTTTLVARLDSSWPCRAWTVVDEAGSVAGVVALQRLAFDAWTAAIHVADARASRHVAAIVNRSAARTVTGLAVDVDPVEPHLTRAAGSLTLPRFVARHPVTGILDHPDEHSGVASPNDLESLIDLYRRHELVPFRTTWQLRSYLRRLIRSNSVVVYREHNEIAGSAIMHPTTDQFLVLTDLSVRRESRERGIGSQLLRRVAAIAEERGVGIIASVAPTNPMGIEDDRVARSTDAEGSHHRIVVLRPAPSVLPRQLARRLYERAGRIQRADNELTLFRDPRDPSRQAGE